MLSSDFIKLLEESAGKEKARQVCAALESEATVSVRLNPAKLELSALRSHFGSGAEDAVDWAPEMGFYLNGRPSFTGDPLFHAGAYYVQEASSMYVGTAVGKGRGRRILDLCAAPGGKSTHILSMLGDDELLVSNEVISSRAGILASNIARWGSPNAVVTSSDPSAFGKMEDFFDMILVDAPCSGEGMFRKDDEAVAEWSADNVRLCAARQRRILSDVWPALRPGGTMIYSTCTFNRLEDEDNAEWICSSLGAELVSQRHFYPGIDRGEGFYCAVLKKDGDAPACSVRKETVPETVKDAADLVLPGYALCMKGTLVKAFPEKLLAAVSFVERRLKTIRSGVAVATRKGRDLIPEADLALSTIYRRGALPEVDLPLKEALEYLSGASLVLEDAPPGFVLVTYAGYPLGFAKNLGNRANNLYPKSQRIRMQIQHLL